MTPHHFAIAAHWTTAFLYAVLLIEEPISPICSTLIFAVVVGMSFPSHLNWRGLLNRLGSKLSRGARPIHGFQHLFLYIAMSSAAIVSMTVFEAFWTGRALIVLMCLVLLHGVVHLWRHADLFDERLRLIAPRALRGLM